ncbi:oxygen-independent coproporphyrinogen III oxidase [Halomonas campaniensis]|uniref:oxygen-independent coproporphyrinogen III oxidase n=1 Tax=Halomonas campaniensis TaxID=213554 RepID=UPI003569AE82
MPAHAKTATRVGPSRTDRALSRLCRHDLDGPRYVTYPRVACFGDGLTADAFAAALERSNHGGRPLSLDVQLPFCRQACRFCACHSIASRDNRQAEPYLSRLDREMVLLTRHLATSREVQRLHWGGGAPTFLSLNQMGDLFDRLDARFGLSGSRERDYSIEVDPREADVFTLRHLQALGFNRLSLGVQELDLRVQKAINRIQPRVLTESLVDEADRLGFRSLNLDLIVGLPLQTRESFAETLDQVIAMAPPRLSLYRYSHLPERYRAQQQIRAEDLPSRQAQLMILLDARQRLEADGYVAIGMGQYARPGDSLAIARANGTLRRDPLGYTPHGPADHIGLGVAAVSQLEEVLARNPESLAAYEAALDAGRLPTSRGIRLTADDRLRGDAIERLLCGMALDLETLSTAHGVDAEASLADALQRLEPLRRDGLLERHGSRLVATAAGELLIHRLAMAFDAYPPPGA